MSRTKKLADTATRLAADTGGAVFVIVVGAHSVEVESAASDADALMNATVAMLLSAAAESALGAGQCESCTMRFERLNAAMDELDVPAGSRSAVGQSLSVHVH